MFPLPPLGSHRPPPSRACGSQEGESGQCQHTARPLLGVETKGRQPGHWRTCALSKGVSCLLASQEGPHPIPHCLSGPLPAHCLSWSHPLLPSATGGCPAPCRPVPGLTRLITQPERSILLPLPSSDLPGTFLLQALFPVLWPELDNSSDTVLNSFKPVFQGRQEIYLSISHCPHPG